MPKWHKDNIHTQRIEDDELYIGCHGCGDSGHNALFAAHYSPDTGTSEKIYTTIYLHDMYMWPNSIVMRIKAAWKMLFGEPTYHRIDVGLDRNDLNNIRDFINKVVTKADTG